MSEIVNIIAAAAQKQQEYPVLRIGQALMNAAGNVYPVFTAAIVGTKYDCFYNNSSVGIFLKALDVMETYASEAMTVDDLYTLIEKHSES